MTWLDFFGDGTIYEMDGGIAIRSVPTNCEVKKLADLLNSTHAGTFKLAPQGKRQPVVYSPQVLGVPFYPQTDNYTMPDRTCNSSSCAMAAKFLGANISGDDEYLAKVLEYGDTVSHEAQTLALKFYGLESIWRTDLGFTDIDTQLAHGKPVPIAILHRGTEEAPTGGHVICVIGRHEDGAYVCHDPYGDLKDGYLSAVENGRSVVYSRKIFKSRWLPEGFRSGWGRIF
ncbi:C39 family peptidase [Pseudanabaena sp. PCC 6802]|uniref:C39 family peptidase n=1 Tax=Pseudanabaena sp. PCC 6802 TaxID=118173 RepID=UPI00034C3888|nr:C39 family peptidase [Pseudanabaena sp. PCC 6802]